MTNNRVPSGVPTGGQFAPGARAESHLRLVEDWQPQSLDDLVPENGSAYLLSGHEEGSEVFDSFSISRVEDSDSFLVTGIIDHDLARGMAESFGWSEEHAEAWLRENQDAVTEELRTRYDIEIDAAAEGWMHRPLRISREVPCDYREDQAVDAIEGDRGAYRAYHELTSPRMQGIAADLHRRLRTGVDGRHRRAERTLSLAEADEFITDAYLAGNITHEEYLATCNDDDAAREATDHLLRRFGARLSEEDETA